MEENSDRDRFTDLFYTVLEQFGRITDHAIDGIRYLQYQSSPPILSLEVVVESAKKLDDLERLLSKAALSTRIESITQEGAVFLGRIQVSADCSQC